MLQGENHNNNIIPQTHWSLSVNLVCIGNWGKAALRNNLCCLLFQPQSCELLPAMSIQGREAQTIEHKQKTSSCQGRQSLCAVIH